MNDNDHGLSGMPADNSQGTIGSLHEINFQLTTEQLATVKSLVGYDYPDASDAVLKLVQTMVSAVKYVRAPTIEMLQTRKLERWHQGSDGEWVSLPSCSADWEWHSGGYDIPQELLTDINQIAPGLRQEPKTDE